MEDVDEGLVPEGASAYDGGEGVDAAEGEDAFYGAVDEAEVEGARVVFLPCGEVEGA